MVQQMINSKFSECRLSNAETNLPSDDKHQSVAVKKAVLRDVQNENRITVSNSHGTSPCVKDRGPVLDATNLSGTKRPSPDSPVKPPHLQSPRNTANGHLVYVCRKPKVKSGKSSVCESSSIQSDCRQPREYNHQDDSSQLKPDIKESKSPCFPAFSPFPVGSLMSSLAKPSIPLGKLGVRFASIESNHQSVASAVPSLNNPKGNVHWEERYHQLQSLLQKFDQSNQEDYLQMLRSLSSVDLSRHAVELEKRSIQLSLEEAKEVQRVAVLNVLGKSVKNVKAPTHQN